MANGDIYEVRPEGLCSSGRRWNNVLHYHLETEVSTGLYDTSSALAEFVQGRYVNQFMPQLAADHFYTSCRAQRIYPSIGIPAVANVQLPVNGQASTQSLPADVSVVITKRTNSPGKRALGRMYMSGIPEASAEFDQLIEAAYDAFGAAIYDFFFTGPNTDTEGNLWAPCVFSPSNAKANPVILPVHANIVRCEFDSTLRNMKTRGRKMRNPIVADNVV